MGSVHWICCIQINYYEQVLSINTDIFESLRASAAYIASILKMPFTLGLMNLCLRVFELLNDLISIDLGAVGVTCNGLVAPVELFVNVAIVGFAVVFIESFSIRQELLYRSDHSFSFKLYKYSSTRETSLKGWKRSSLDTVCWGWLLDYGIQSFVNLIQLLMGMIYFKGFVEDYGVHGTSHGNNAAGLTGIDTTMAVFSSIIAIYSFIVISIHSTN